MTREEAGSASAVIAIVAKEGTEASVDMPPRESPWRRGSKSRSETLEAHEKRLHKTDPSSKKVVPETPVQPDEKDEETESALVHRKRKVFVQVGPEVVRMALYWIFSL